MPEKMARFIVKHRNKIGLIFGVILIVSIILIPFVNINYDLSKYIPNDEPSKHGLNVVEEEFGMQGTARAMVKNVSLVEAKEIKDKIEAIPGVDMVVWLDSAVDIYQPESFIPKELLNDYYKDRSAVFDIMFEKDDYDNLTNSAIDKLFKILPEDANVCGSAIEVKSARDSIKSEIAKVMALLIPTVIIILLLTTNSWFSPILFLLVIGTSILINMGTNIMFDSVAFVTYSIVAALQLAVSMDYSVFLLHKFSFERERIDDPEEALVQALRHSGVSICSSALTTVAGFVALTFMSFTIGRDMGLVFAKGIVISLLCVIFLMPCLIMFFYKKIESTTHKSLIGDLSKMAKFADKFGIVIIVVVMIIIIPSYFAQKENSFLYGVSAFGGGEGTRAHSDEIEIVNKFGRSTPLILMVPNGNYVDVKNMVDELEDIKEVRNVQSLINLVPEGVPDSFVPIDKFAKFKNDKYSRILVYLRTSAESEIAFNGVNEIKEVANKYYGDNYEITGPIPVTMDTKETINKDYGSVNMISIVSVMVILLFTFKSMFLPILLILVIEGGIFINMALPYYMGTDLIFIGYLIVTSIQLGATIDYAILFTNNYLSCRTKLDSKEASIAATALTVPSILTSGGILVCAGYMLGNVSTLKAVSEMGELIGRGALISVILVTFFLPHVVRRFDKVIFKSIWKKKGVN